MAARPTKTDRRVTLEAPYWHEHDRSLGTRMERGVMPKSLDALVAWLMAIAADETPPRLHKSGVWHDHGEHAQGGSALGSPALAAEFRRYIEEGPSGLDADGYYRTPLRATISRMRRRMPHVAAHVEALIRCEGNWQMLAEFLHQEHDVARLYLGEALRVTWREHSDRSVRLE